jgi:hypothetical protein
MSQSRGIAIPNMCNRKCLPFKEDMNSPPVFSAVSIARSFVFCAMFCRSLFVLLSCFFWPLCELVCSGMVSSSCLTSDNRRVTLVTKHTISHE